ncbi:DUF3080 family protein [Aeromonas diversa]|uniref:DUF3080 family protein n=1 Tax=Aeromonas diversa TaxID=502790 RepID=UPI0039A319AC
MGALRTASLLLLLLMAGCQPAMESSFDTYLTRLGAIVDAKPPPLGAPDPIPLPRQRDLMLPLPELKVELLDILTLSRCGLGREIAERNGPLGMSADHLTLLDYELNLVRRLEGCDSQDPATRQWLAELAQTKRAMLPLRAWNALASDPVLRRQLSPRPPLSEPDPASDQPLESLLHRWLQLRQSAAGTLDWREQADLLARSAQLRGSGELGRLLYRMESATFWLDTSTRWLTPLLEALPCGPDPERVVRLRGALTHYYGKGVQPELSLLERRFLRLAPLLQQLMAPPAPLPAITPWRLRYGQGRESGLYLDFRRSIGDHTRLWQRLLARCQVGIRP